MKQGDDSRWPQVKMRVLRISEGQDNLFKNIILAISKYDYYGARQDWEPKYNKEKTMFEWATWIIKEGKPKKIKKMCEEYDDDKIPDAFSFMLQYFT